MENNNIDQNSLQPQGGSLSMSSKNKEKDNDLQILNAEVSESSNATNPESPKFTLVGYIIPDIERIPWYHFIVLSTMVAIP